MQTIQLIEENQLAETTQLIGTTQLLETTQLAENTQLIKTNQLIETIPLIDTTHNIAISESLSALEIIPVLKRCTYYDFLKELCKYFNYTNYLILNVLIPGLIETYPNSNGSNIIIKGEDNITFQITTEKNENDIFAIIR